MLLRLALLSIAVTAVALTAPAEAQLNNRPYDFGGQGIGMSSAYRAAYLDAEIDGIRPDNLIRTPSGGLLTVDEGPDGVALARNRAGVLVATPLENGLPRGSVLDGNGAGLFNSYFRRDDDGGGGVAVGAPTASAEQINGWTTIASGGVPGGRGPVGQWTSQAMLLPPAM